MQDMISAYFNLVALQDVKDDEWLSEPNQEEDMSSQEEKLQNEANTMYEGSSRSHLETILSILNLQSMYGWIYGTFSIGLIS